MDFEVGKSVRQLAKFHTEVISELTGNISLSREKPHEIENDEGELT